MSHNAMGAENSALIQSAAQHGHNKGEQTESEHSLTTACFLQSACVFSHNQGCHRQCAQSENSDVCQVHRVPKHEGALSGARRNDPVTWPGQALVTWPAQAS
eukprot:11578599-Alexandrium_andersonii.AAC.1